MESKFTEKDIMKAIECCSKANSTFDSEACKRECPYNGACNDRERGVNLMDDIRDLFNRKNTEIIILREKIDLLKSTDNIKFAAVIDFIKKIHQDYSVEKLVGNVNIDSLIIALNAVQGGENNV